MENLLQQLLGILVNPPGNLIYHLTLAFSIFASLQTALIHRRSGESSGRVLLGLNLILIAQLALFLSSGLAWQNILSAHIFLPVFDRAVIVFSLIWIGWLWAFPQANRIADIVTGVLNLAAVILFFLTLNLWSREGASLPFNGGWQDWTWSFAGIAVMVAAITAVLLRRPNGWAIGIGMAALNLVGLVAHLFLYDGNGDFAAFIRLAQLAAFPLLPGLLTRQSMAPVSKTAPEQPLAAGQLAPVGAQTTRLNRVADPRVIHPWIDLNLQNDPVRICTGVAHAVAQSMMADICYVVSAPADARSSFIIQGGYDLVREEDLPGTILEQSQVPNVAAALTKARSLRITPLDSRVPDLKAMADVLKLKEVGSVLVIPLTQVGRPWGGLILLSPYSNRSWTPEDQSLLASEAEAITAILSRAQNQFDRKTELDRLRDSLNTAARETEDLRLHNQQLLNDINALRSANTNQAKPAASADMEALIAVQQDTQEALTNLQNENSRLKNMLKMGSAATSLDVSQMENELRSVLQEVARLQNLLAKSNSRINELEHAIPVPTPSSADLSAIAATIQELRQPMSSIVGYTELLLAESIGILGKAQKKFLEHIRSSSERLQGLIDDMAKIISPGPVTVVETQQPVVNLTDVIDEAVAELGPKMRERGIQLHLDMPEELPDIYSDKDAIFQITNHLLQNAAQVTPVDGTISLRAHHQRDGSLDFIVLQVTDSGGGILPDDLPLIFTQRLRDDGTPISGISEDAVGLTVTKTLVDAIGGRIWVDAELGLTSTFTVLLPMPSGTTQESAAQ